MPRKRSHKASSEATEATKAKQSKLSKEDRREIRQAERDLHANLRTDRDHMGNINSSKFKENLVALNELNEHVGFAREANLDAVNLSEFSNAVNQQASALASHDLTLMDITTFCAQVLPLDTNTPWASLGEATHGCFQGPVQTSFFMGVMTTELKSGNVGRKTGKRNAATSSASVPEKQLKDYDNFQENRKDAQTRRLKIMKDVMQREKTVELFALVVNPSSFSETVENLFDSSFLIKDSELGLYLQDGVPTIGLIDGLGNLCKSGRSGEIEKVDQETACQVQCVSSITPAQHREIISAFDLDHPTFPLVGRRRNE